MIRDFAKVYLLKIKNLSILLGIFFVISIFLGYAIAHNYPEQTKETIYNSLKNMLEPAKDYTVWQLFTFIFFKNLIVALISVLLGIIFGIVPVLIVFINGLTLGIVSYIILEQHNIIFLLAGILPHGIFEIPALIFSAASGLWLWRSLCRYVRHDENKIKEEFVSIIKFFILVIIPMLALAALIEAFITPRILDLIMLLA